MLTAESDYSYCGEISTLESFDQTQKMPLDQEWRVSYRGLWGVVRRREEKLLLEVPCLFERVEPVEHNKTELASVFKVWRPGQESTIFNTRTGHEVSEEKFKPIDSSIPFGGINQVDYLEDSDEFLLVNNRFVFQESLNRIIELPFRVGITRIHHYMEVHEHRFLLANDGSGVRSCVVSLAGEVLVRIR